MHQILDFTECKLIILLIDSKLLSENIGYYRQKHVSSPVDLILP